ncbi:hypothetical protein [Desulfovirgula thermocuniculi]|uniref:hypothetical protein n=1 Tax=Desulfovirgula thermocuniculi TaxID=348842 RepID=UPI00047F3915|nr:hypothetical protein [Desulfovirgula thermocuniculi]
MVERQILEVFHQRKEEFLKNISGADKKEVVAELKRFLDWFEQWLHLEAEEQKEREPQAARPRALEEFLDEVLAETKRILAERRINITYTLPGQNLGAKESWKCVKVFGNSGIYYRIGRTRPRKGPYRGQDLLVIDLVMDGYKKKVFLPLLELKGEIEKRLGVELQRELPKVEATGKYRLKFFLPYDVVRRGDAALAARKFAHFIAVTKPLLNSLGVS